MPPHRPDILVQPEWLEEHLGDDAVRVVDLREPLAFEESHVPGAVHLELASLGTSRPGMDNVLLAAPDFAVLMESLGISTGDTVVAYDDQWGLAASRLVWALHHYGHQSASVMDGGWDRWREEGRPVSDRRVSATRGRFDAQADPAVAADLRWLSQQVASAAAILLDTRTPAEFDSGHLPGAKSWDWFTAVPPGSWDVARDLDELRAEWSALGVAPESEVVVYCRSGMRAAHTYVVLRHAGYTRVRLYDGSWQEWSMSMTEVERG